MYDIGRKTNVCIGFEASDHFTFNQPVRLGPTSGTVREIVGKALRQFPHYCMGEQHRVLTIALCSQAKNTWMDYRIKSIHWQRGFLQAISNGLYLSLEGQVTPRKGWGGHFRSGVINDVIGPYDLHGETVRALLNRFVGDSQGAMWFTDRPFTRSIRAGQKRNPDRFWRVFEYQESPEQNAGDLRLAKSGATEAFCAELRSGCVR